MQKRTSKKSKSIEINVSKSTKRIQTATNESDVFIIHQKYKNNKIKNNFKFKNSRQLIFQEV